MAKNVLEGRTLKIVLINPPSPFLETPAMDIPLGLAYISSYIKSKRYDDVTLVDYNLLPNDYRFSSQYLKEIPLDCEF